MNMMNRIINENDSVVFNDEEEKIVKDFDIKFNNDIKNILNEMIVKEVTINEQKYVIGYVKCPYKYRNDINEFVINDNKYDVDLVGMIMTDLDTVSYRLVKDVDASTVAVYFGGKGHKKAATNPQDNELFKKLFENN